MLVIEKLFKVRSVGTPRLPSDVLLVMFSGCGAALLPTWIPPRLNVEPAVGVLLYTGPTPLPARLIVELLALLAICARRIGCVGIIARSALSGAEAKIG